MIKILKLGTILSVTQLGLFAIFVALVSRSKNPSETGLIRAGTSNNWILAGAIVVLISFGFAWLNSAADKQKLKGKNG